MKPFSLKDLGWQTTKIHYAGTTKGGPKLNFDCEIINQEQDPVGDIATINCFQG